MNREARELSVKIVYYGPGLGGKTTTVQRIHRALGPDARGQLVSLATGTDRTLYFDFLPITLAKLAGYRVRVHLYTVPGQVHYNSTRKLVLSGVDGIVFVADSQPERMISNQESLANLDDNLREQGLRLDELPLVFQYNKRDTPSAAPIAELEAQLNGRGAPSFATVATTGAGVFDALKSIVKLTVTALRRKGILEASDGAATGSAPPDASNATDAQRATAAPVLHSLSDLGEAIDRLAEAPALAPAPEPGAPVGAVTAVFGELLASPAAIAKLAELEAHLHGGRWSEVVRQVGQAHRAVVANLAGTLGPSDAVDATTLATALLAIPAARLLRLREAEHRSRAGDTVTSADAAFALLVFVDAALRADQVTLATTT